MIKERFSLFLVLSLLGHLALFGLVVILGPEAGDAPSPAAVKAADLQTFRQALRDYAADGEVPERLAKAMIGLSEEELAEAFRQAPVLDNRLTGQEKAGLYKRMAAEALANFTEGTGGRSALDEPLSRYFGSLREMPRTDPADDYELVKVGDALDEGARLFRISKENAREIEALSLLTPGPGDHKDRVLLQDERGRVEAVPGEYFYRDSSYLKFVAMGAQLFYVVKGFPDLPSAASVGAGTGPARPPAAELSPTFSVVYLPLTRPPVALPAAPSTRPALTLGPGEADRILDGLMTLPGDEQVRTFYRDYLRKYDPDSQSLADLTTAFIYWNLGMVFILMDNPLSRGFDLLEEIYYDNLSQDELVPFALENPATRTGTAILLCLAAAYEFERRVIAALDGSLDAAQKILADPDDDRYFVHNKNVKAYVLREVYQDLAAELHRRNYGSLESVLQKYQDEQLEIYDTLVRMGGEARSRALYALGRLYWDEGDVNLAMTLWKGIDPVLVKGIASDVRQALTGQYPVQRIDYILGKEAASDKGRLFERIGRFHKWGQR